MSTPQYILDFIAAVCPEAPDLYMASFNERTCLVDATKLIVDLRQRERRLQVLIAYRADAEVGQVEAAMALGVKWNEVDELADDAELQGYQIVEEALADKEAE